MPSPAPSPSPARDRLAPAQASSADEPGVLADAPSPAVTAIYLRPHRGVQHVDPSETLVDSITRIVAGMLEQHIRESVTAAVRALAPRLLISFPSDAAPAPAEPAGFIQGRLDDSVFLAD